MTDAVYQGFLGAAREDAQQIRVESDILRLLADRQTGDPPCTYHGLFRQVEHFARSTAGRIVVSSEPIAFSIHFPADYLRSTDPNLQFRVLRVDTPLVHPNVRGGLVCLGPAFRPATRLRSLVEVAFGIFSSRVFATDHAFDSFAQQFFWTHLEEVRRLRAAPLWRRPLAVRVHVEEGRC